MSKYTNIMVELRKNMILEWSVPNGTPRIERIIHIGDDGTYLWTVQLKRKHWPVRKAYHEVEADLRTGRAILLDHDPTVEELSFDPKYRVKHQEEQRSNWKMIRQLVQSDYYDNHDDREAVDINEAIFDRTLRSRLVDSIAVEYKTSPRKVYELLGRAIRSGFNPDSVFPQLHRSGGHGKLRPATPDTPKRGRPTKTKHADGSSIGVNLTEYVRDSFERGYELFFLNEKAKTLAACFRSILVYFFFQAVSNQFGIKNVPTFLDATTIPNINQFYAWHEQACDRIKELKARHGQAFVQANRRARRGRVFQMAQGPGACYMLDATILDVYLRSTLNPNIIIGRPILYILVDVATWTIAGFHVDIGPPCPETAFLAIENAFSDKVAYCAKYGIDISKWHWPAEGLPKKIYIDRSELRGQAADNMMEALRITMDTAPPYRPDWKSMVERWFRLINDLALHSLPGTTYTLAGREGHEYRLDARLTLDELRRLLIYIILAHNTAFKLNLKRLGKLAIEDDVPPYPNDFWAWGIRNRSGCLHWEDPRIVRLNLLPRGKARVTADGLLFKPADICRDMPERLQYSCVQTSLESSFERIRMQSKEMWIDIVYEPRLVDYIYRRLDNGLDVEIYYLHPTNEHFKGMSWEEVNDFHLRDAQQQPQQSLRELNALALVETIVRQTIGRSRRQRPKLSVNKRELRVQMTAGRKLERRWRRKQQVWILSQAESPMMEIEQSELITQQLPAYQVDDAQLRRLEKLDEARLKKLRG